MKEIRLRGRKHVGLIALVDDEDFERLSAFRWYAHFPYRSLTMYARTVLDGKTIYMHQMVFGQVSPGFEIDHKDRNGLNNQSSNLRMATRSANMLNGGRTVPFPASAGVHTVWKTLSDGSRRVYFYDRKTRMKLTQEEAESRTNV